MRFHGFLAMVRAAALGNVRPRGMLAPFAPGPTGKRWYTSIDSWPYVTRASYPCHSTLDYHCIYPPVLVIGMMQAYFEVHMQYIFFPRRVSFVPSLMFDRTATSLIFSPLLNYTSLLHLPFVLGIRFPCELHSWECASVHPCMCLGLGFDRAQAPAILHRRQTQERSLDLTAGST